MNIFIKQIYWYIPKISGERLQDHWSSDSKNCSRTKASMLLQCVFEQMKIEVRKNKCLGTTVLVGNKASFPTGMVATLARIFSSLLNTNDGFYLSPALSTGFTTTRSNEVNRMTTGLSIIKTRPYNSHQCLRKTKTKKLTFSSLSLKTLIVGSC